jgi:hypothetical protein
VFVFHHIPKTAGSALRAVVMANAGANFVDLDRQLVRGRPDLLEADQPALRREGLAFFDSTYGDRPHDGGDDARYFAGHSAPLFLPAVRDRSVRAFCLLRDPVDRVLSMYFHFRRHFQTPKAQARSAQVRFAGLVEPLERESWTLKEIYQTSESSGESLPPRSVFTDLFNGQVRHLLMGSVDPSEIPLEPDHERLDIYKQRVDRLLGSGYLVGTQERFSQSVHLFGETFGWRRRFVPVLNANPDSSLRERVDGETLELIRVHNQLDAELHDRYSEQLRNVPATSRVSDARWKAYLQAHRRARRLRRRVRARLRT